MLEVVRIWVLISALLVGCGWVLSAFHQLNRSGYGVIFALTAMAAVYWRQEINWPRWGDLLRTFHKCWSRFKRPAPLLFLMLALMALVAGSIYVHANGDSNAYRIPRVLHWLGRERWHWIDTEDERMNIVACNFEWLSAPLILFTRTDRLLFLINWVSYLMLPGLIFGVFTQLQVRPRVAWWWMWLLSSGWCFALQAGSDVNDSFAAIYALAAVYFALRARKSQLVTDLWFSMLAAGLLTGVKQTDIPLALLWLIAAWPNLRLLLTRRVATTFVVVVSLLVSAGPVVAMCIEHCGNWDGQSPGVESTVWNGGSPFWRVVGNVYSIPTENLALPYFPYADVWNSRMAKFVHTPLGAHFAEFEQFGCFNQGVSEKNAGVGLGICILTSITLLGGAWHRKQILASCRTTPFYSFIRSLWIAPWALLLLFMTQLCNYQNARLLAAYYVFLFPLLLTGPGQKYLIRRPWWQRLGLCIMFLTAMMLVVSRDRPLFPAKTIIGQLHAEFPNSKLLSTLWSHYAWPSSVTSLRSYLKEDLPQGERVIGYATIDGFCEPGLWLPFGRDQVERVLVKETAEQLRRHGMHYVVVEDDALARANLTIGGWAKKYSGDVVNQIAIMRDPYRPMEHLYFVRLDRDYSLPKQ